MNRSKGASYALAGASIALGMCIFLIWAGVVGKEVTVEQWGGFILTTILGTVAGLMIGIEN